MKLCNFFKCNSLLPNTGYYTVHLCDRTLTHTYRSTQPTPTNIMHIKLHRQAVVVKKHDDCRLYGPYCSKFSKLA